MNLKSNKCQRSIHSKLLKRGKIQWDSIPDATIKSLRRSVIIRIKDRILTIDRSSNWHVHVCGVTSHPCWAGFDRRNPVSDNALLNIQLYTHWTVIAIHKHTSTISHTHTSTHAFHLFVSEFNVTASASFYSFFQGPTHRTPQQTSAPASLCREADATALHTDFQAIWGLAAGIHDATVHVTGAVAVIAQVISAAAAAASLRRACTTWGLRHHHVAKCQELTKQAGQDAVDAAVWVRMSKPVRATSYNIKQMCKSIKKNNYIDTKICKICATDC